MMATAFAEDEAVCRVADAYGLDLSRFEGIEITDPAAIAAAGLVREAIDYGRIRKLLESGRAVDGARMTGNFEYKLRQRR